MNKQEYRSALGRLPIVNPTPEDIVSLCPHLTIEESMAALTTGSGYVACPPLRVKGSFQIIDYQKEWTEKIFAGDIVDGIVAESDSAKIHPARINWAFTGRTTDSYTNYKPYKKIHCLYKYMDRAIEFAENNWGKDLVDDDWISVIKIHIEDPAELESTRYLKKQPRLKTTLYVALNRDLNDIDLNDQADIDRCVSEMTLDGTIWREIKGDRGEYTSFACAHCGEPLSIFGCANCGFEFNDNDIHCEGFLSLSEKMLNFLHKNGYDIKAKINKPQIKKQHQQKISC